MQRREFIKYAGAIAATGILAGCAGDKLGLFRMRTDPEPVTPNHVRAQHRDLAFRSKYSSGLRRVSCETGAFPGPSPRIIEAEPRAAWGPAAPIRSRLRPMGAVQRVTIHHEGSPHPNHDWSRSQVARTLRRIQVEHGRRMHAGDIGYHYIIDRAGRVWEGRDSRYQGAHVSHYNPHNLGIMVLGNFDIQSPTAAQISSLTTLCHMLLHGYQISAHELYMHRNLANTRCPGRRMVKHVISIRNQLLRA